MTSPYTTASEVVGLLGEMGIASSINPDALAKDAADEMDVRFGERFTVPLNTNTTATPPAVSIAPHHKKLLGLINKRLAAGRLLMGTTSPSESHELWAYGKYLVELAYADLDAIMSGRVVLTGQADAAGLADATAGGPAIYNHDEESAIEIYEDWALRGASAWWTPGAAIFPVGGDIGGN